MADGLKAAVRPMPWTAADARRKTRKANTPKRKRQWAHVANSVLKRTGDDARAVREANAVLKQGFERRPFKH